MTASFPVSARPHSTLDLRGLPCVDVDAKLSEAVAVHVAGWTYAPMHPGANRMVWHRPNPADGWIVTYDGAFTGDPYATSSDAVMPLIERYKFNKASRWVGGAWIVSVDNDLNNHTHQSNGYARTLPRAACLALLCAVGVPVLIDPPFPAPSS